MTARQRIEKLVDRLRVEAERDHALGGLLLGKAGEARYLADALSDILPDLSDAQCDQVVEKWGDEAKVN